MFPIKPRNLDDVCAIEHVCFPDPWTRKMFEAELCAARGRALGLREKDGVGLEIIGYLFFHLVADEMDVLKIAVLPGFRRAGYAAGLMHAGFREACEHGVKKSILEVRASNAAAILFYGSLGFEVIGCRPSYYNHPSAEDALVMRKYFKRRKI